jgi:hypothetical protein
MPIKLLNDKSKLSRIPVINIKNFATLAVKPAKELMFAPFFFVRVIN